MIGEYSSKDFHERDGEKLTVEGGICDSKGKYRPTVRLVCYDDECNVKNYHFEPDEALRLAAEITRAACSVKFRIPEVT